MGDVGEHRGERTDAVLTVRRIAPSDGPLLRRTRLAAIADSPGSYATTLAEAERQPAEKWVRVADEHAVATDQGTWFAEVDGVSAGMVSAYRTHDDVVTFTSLWAAPGYRGIGVAEHLVLAVAEWARSVGGRQLRLWVVERNEHARRFYTRLGFEATGQEITHEPDPRLIETELRKSLVHAG